MRMSMCFQKARRITTVVFLAKSEMAMHWTSRRDTLIHLLGKRGLIIVVYKALQGVLL